MPLRQDSMFTSPPRKGGNAKDRPYHFEVAFEKRGTTPVLVRRHLSRGEYWIKEYLRPNKPYVLRVGTSRGTWERQISLDEINIPSFVDEERILLPPLFLFMLNQGDKQEEGMNFTSLSDSPAISSEDLKLLHELAYSHMEFPRKRPFASAPVRSKPRRTLRSGPPHAGPGRRLRSHVSRQCVFSGQEGVD